MNSIILEKIRAVILGHAVADAVGVPAEFRSRSSLDKNPITDMQGYGTYHLPAGCWSDDTTMNLAALDSLAQGRVDFDDIMEKFLGWVEHGDYTPEGRLFDIGITCKEAILRYRSGTPALLCGACDEYSNGNGSLMRILPFILFARYGNYPGDSIQLYHNASALTHGHMRSKIACGIYGILIEELLSNPSKATIAQALADAEKVYRNEPELVHYSRLFDPDFAITPRHLIRSSGYVVDSLEAAIWCVLNTQSYRDCVLMAVNLGSDTDTVAAIAGGMAGALYGMDSIPMDWLQQLKRLDVSEFILLAFAEQTEQQQCRR